MHERLETHANSHYLMRLCIQTLKASNYFSTAVTVSATVAEGSRGNYETTMAFAALALANLYIGSAFEATTPTV